MDSYLNIARIILEAAKKPLSAKQMLEFAYLHNLAPKHLYGRTQHKTLQARLSEDILERGSHSEFYRTEPGTFFLRKFLVEDAAEEIKEFHSRRRERDLQKHPILAFKRENLPNLENDEVLDIEQFQEILSSPHVNYVPYGEAKNPNNVIIWSFVVICRGHHVLSYRKGRYRERRDSFVNKQTIGFKSLLTNDDRSLFDKHDHGLVWSGISKAIVDVGMPLNALDNTELNSRSELNLVMAFEEEKGGYDIVGIVTFDCPEWFEPTARRLAINNLRWLDLRNHINHIDDFDPWSQKVIERLKPFLEEKATRRKLDAIHS